MPTMYILVLLYIYAVDGEILVVKNLSSMTFPDEN